MQNHKFRKTNLVTISSRKGGYDTVECEWCGLKGKRHGFSEEVETTSLKSCSPPKEIVKSMVEITNGSSLATFGFSEGDRLKTVDCPEEQKAKFGNDVWVFSEKRSEAVRLLPEEYKFMD